MDDASISVPVELPVELDKDLFCVAHPLRMPGGIELGTRTTIVRLADGGLWLHSPGPLGAALRGWLAERGPVRAIVAPNLLHHLFVSETAAAFPDAAVFGPPGLDRKVDLPIRVVDPAAPDGLPWRDDLETALVDGAPRMNELVFFHARTRTLVLTDLAFHFRSVDSARTRVFLRINGALGSFGPSRLAKYAVLRDRALVKASVERILAWDFDRVVVPHGDVLETGGHAAMRAAFAWLLER